ncbi:MAG: hypothetical protein D3925_10010 [Candidatus Electrothrix sp. AR5]|nr:hypothetical protein [Candidatus Electrothrix sp. AR5]
MKEVGLYTREDLHQEDQAVACTLCHHRCRIRPSKRGRCEVRENQEVLDTVRLLRELGVWQFPLHDAGSAE